jgi:rod shape-determining protein MreC
MDGLFSRYRNLSVLLLLIAGQLILLAWQIKSNGDTRLLRIWAVSAVTPVARGIETGREAATGLAQRWFTSGTLERENSQLRRTTAELRMRTQLLEQQLGEAGRAQALLEFRSTIPSHTLAARILGSAPGVESGVLFVDRGSGDGVKRGMAVVTGDGIAAVVVASYPTASLILLANSQGFAASVISQQHKLRGLLRGTGGAARVEGIRNELPVEVGEWFYTSGDDRIFPRGLRVGQVRAVKDGTEGKEIELRVAALDGDYSELLIVTDGVHGQVPEPNTPAATDMQVLPAPPGAATPPQGEAAAPAEPDAAGGAAKGAAPAAQAGTDADALKKKYRAIAAGQGSQIGTTPYRAPDFNRAPAAAPAATAPAPAAAKAPAPPVKPPAADSAKKTKAGPAKSAPRPQDRP